MTMILTNFMISHNYIKDLFKMFIGKLLKTKYLHWSSRYLSTRIKLNGGFPKEEENLDILLREMNNAMKPNSLNGMINQKDDIVHINANAYSTARLGEYIIFNNKYVAQCVAIKENLITLMLLDRIKYIILIQTSK
jgi:hypothetical protein